jgi:hypothetical protein
MEPEGFEPSSSPLRLGVLEQLPGTPARCNRRPHAAAPCRECSVMETARTRSSSVQARCSAVRASSRVCCVRSRYSSGTRAPLEHPGDLAQRLDQGVAGGQGRSDAVAAVPNHVPVALPCEADRGRLAAVLEPPVAGNSRASYRLDHAGTRTEAAGFEPASGHQAACAAATAALPARPCLHAAEGEGFEPPKTREPTRFRDGMPRQMAVLPRVAPAGVEPATLRLRGGGSAD